MEGCAAALALRPEHRDGLARRSLVARIRDRNPCALARVGERKSAPDTARAAGHEDGAPVSPMSISMRPPFFGACCRCSREPARRAVIRSEPFVHTDLPTRMRTRFIRSPDPRLDRGRGAGCGRGVRRARRSRGKRSPLAGRRPRAARRGRSRRLEAGVARQSRGHRADPAHCASPSCALTRGEDRLDLLGCRNTAAVRSSRDRQSSAGSACRGRHGPDEERVPPDDRLENTKQSPRQRTKRTPAFTGGFMELAGLEPAASWCDPAALSRRKCPFYSALWASAWSAAIFPPQQSAPPLTKRTRLAAPPCYRRGAPASTS